MATDYPASVDTSSKLPNPAAGDKTNSPAHSGLHNNTNDAIKAVQTKLGTGASTPVVNTLLLGTGTGTSAYTQLTSAQLAGAITDETGTGKAVFGTSPILITPAVDTINESTPGNGTTVGGINLKSGAATLTSVVGTGVISSTNLASASITPNKLATGAASALVATSETTTSTSFTDLATVTDTVTVTIGANGLALLIISGSMANSGANYSIIGYTASGTNTVAASDAQALFISAAAETQSSWCKLITGLNTGSTVFKLKYRVTAGTGTFKNRSIAVVPL